MASPIYFRLPPVHLLSSLHLLLGVFSLLSASPPSSPLTAFSPCLWLRIKRFPILALPFKKKKKTSRVEHFGFSRQEYWSELPFPSPEDLPHPGKKPGSPALHADALLSEPPGKPLRYLSVQFSSVQLLSRV